MFQNSFEIKYDESRIKKNEIERQKIINPSRKDYKILQQKIVLRGL